MTMLYLASENVDNESRGLTRSDTDTVGDLCPPVLKSLSCRVASLLFCSEIYEQ